MTTLRDARKTGSLDKFVAEHEADPPGDMARLGVAIKRPAAGTEKSNQGASKPDSGGD